MEALPPGTPLTPQQKEHWNIFIDYLQKTGYKGSPKLDNRSMELGKGLLLKFNQQNPGSQINYDDVQQVQNELQNYRNSLIQQWKTGKAQASPDIKTENDIMPGLSNPDGWLGSRTSSYKFPTATMTNTDGTKQNFGTNTAAFDSAIAGIKK